MQTQEFTDSLFMPYLLQRECFNEPDVVAVNIETIMDSGRWVEDEDGVCYIPDLMKLEISFDGDINSHKDFDIFKAEIFSIVGTKPNFLNDEQESSLTRSQHSTTMKNIINCFSGNLMNLPEQLQIYDDLLHRTWSYRYINDVRLYPCVVDGNLVFECIE